MTVKNKRSSHMSEKTKKRIAMIAAIALGVPLAFGVAKNTKESQVSNRQESDFAVLHSTVCNRIARESNEYKEICILEYIENGIATIRMVEYYKTINNRMYYRSITSPEIIVSELKDEQGNFKGYEIVKGGEKTEYTNVRLATWMGGPDKLTPEEAEAKEKFYTDNYDTWHVATVEDANGLVHSCIYEITYKINGEVVTKLMYVTNNGKENIYVSITEPDGKIVEKLDTNGNTIYYYSASVYPIEQGILDVISVKTYTEGDLTFEEAVSYEEELNAENKIVRGGGLLLLRVPEYK